MVTKPLSSSSNAERALDIVLALGEVGPEGLSLAEIAERMGCAKSVAHRSLVALLQKGFAEPTGRALARITPHIPKTVPKDPLSQQAEVALASFKAGVCVSANLTIGQFDSHQKNDEDQMRLIPRLLSSVDYLLRRA